VVDPAIQVPADTAASNRVLHTGAVELANLGSYGVLWVLQFVLCDRVLFKKVGSVQGQGEPERVDRAA